VIPTKVTGVPGSAQTLKPVSSEELSFQVQRMVSVVIPAEPGLDGAAGGGTGAGNTTSSTQAVSDPPEPLAFLLVYPREHPLADQLARHQREDGSWLSCGEAPIVDTAFALLFLKRAVLPVETPSKAAGGEKK
jgi:hypothetical protein